MEDETGQRAVASIPAWHDAPAHWTIRDAAWAVCLWMALTAWLSNVPNLCLWVMEAAGKLPDGLTSSAQDACARRVAIPWALSGLLSAIVATRLAAREFPATLRDFGVRKPEMDIRWFIRFSALLAAVYGIGGLLLLKLAHGIVVVHLVPWREISSYGLWPVVLFLCVSAPLGEEVVFRGILYPALRDKLGVWKATVVSAAAFAVMHNVLAVRLFAPATQFAGGLIFAYSYEKSRSLLLPVLYHACGNALLFIGYALA